jgi:phosphoenolpyruvate synthase/pyruvate phosphate dikinase
MHCPKSLLWLGHPDAHDPALVGGKAANLSRLAARYRVPAGFCLTTAAFDQASALIDRHPDVLPPALADALAAAYQALAARDGVAEPRVAVRSSAADEDGSAASFAGQHATYLNVASMGAIASAVRRCWESARAERAAAYRRQHGLASERVRLAILVQRMVAADVSAVLFSANPLTGSADEVVINASWGLGESLVGGTVTPDTYVARKADRALVVRQIAEKQRMTVAIPGGTQEVDVPRLLRAQTALDDAQLAELVQLACALEAQLGWPVDVECAYHAGKLYLLQCRPITTPQPATMMTIPLQQPVEPILAGIRNAPQR